MARMVARVLCAALLATVGLLAAPTGPAGAALRWVTRDDMDDDPESRWVEDGTGTFNTAFLADSGRLNSIGGFVQSYTVGQWASLGRTVNILAATPHCTASIYLRPWRWRTDGHLYVWVEVIDPATWTYLAVKQTDLRWTDGTFSQFTTPRFTAAQVFFRVSVMGPDRPTAKTSFDMDDLRIDCSSV